MGPFYSTYFGCAPHGREKNTEEWANEAEVIPDRCIKCINISPIDTAWSEILYLFCKWKLKVKLTCPQSLNKQWQNLISLPHMLQVIVPSLLVVFLHKTSRCIFLAFPLSVLLFQSVTFCHLNWQVLSELMTWMSYCSNTGCEVRSILILRTISSLHSEKIKIKKKKRKKTLRTHAKKRSICFMHIYMILCKLVHRTYEIYVYIHI